MSKPKIIAMYLPQFHQIPENDEFWGKGFTDWVTVKNANPLYEGHQQPRVPLNDNYYDLSIKENVEWQCKLAYEHGIYGFGVYHYWFNNEKNLLTKPAEIMRDADNIKTKYFFAWDNGSWKRSWSNVPGNDWAPVADATLKNQTGPQILIPYILGSEEDWKNHYYYVRTHFFSNNYEKIDNKPVFCIYSYSENLISMCDYWEKMAKEDGFDGIYFVFKNRLRVRIPAKYHVYYYQPHYAGWDCISMRRIIVKLLRLLSVDIEKGITYYNYDKVWKKLLKIAKQDKMSNSIHGAFVCYDDSPRRGSNRSKIVLGATPEKFHKYFKELIRIAEKQCKDFIFITAWNEWGEGAYLEPDTLNKTEYLDVLKSCTLDNY